MQQVCAPSGFKNAVSRTKLSEIRAQRQAPERAPRPPASSGEDRPQRLRAATCTPAASPYAAPHHLRECHRSDPPRQRRWRPQAPVGCVAALGVSSPTSTLGCAPPLKCVAAGARPLGRPHRRCASPQRRRRSWRKSEDARQQQRPTTRPRRRLRSARPAADRSWRRREVPKARARRVRWATRRTTPRRVAGACRAR